MQIVRDSREQVPFHFDGPKFEGVTVIDAPLATGDYSLAGLESRVAVERKSLPDFMASISTGRERFERELTRARGLDAFMVVVEAPFSDLVAGNYRSKMQPKAATQTVYSFMSKYRATFHFAQNRAWAEFATFHFLRHYAKQVEREYKAAVKTSQKAA
ncbi:ERCC4 domain-containing protein [Desulfovibrio sp. Huiquan2017]|uniref:ERCC4 domain-containing protein n=1 Tax=Desulfovibrio sp. Huiquan2017 TaxID=2816861 RepID=UPI001A928086|nr:ERCC4 domain-containing protein [Desulfovibrio sp. Huiquan2017]